MSTVNENPSATRLKRVSELYGRHPGSDIYVVGTGASLRVFPTGFLEGRITIGTNLAWRNVPVTYGITIHPELNIPEILGEGSRPEITWITKREKLSVCSEEHRRWADERCYYFRTDGRANTMTNGQSDAGRFPEWVRRPTGDFLYLWTSIAQPAVNLAANMGARNVILVGCDCTSLFGNHHATGQHTMWLGADPADRYHDYYDALAEVRAALRDRGVNLVSLQPFIGLGPHEEDFVRLCRELSLPELIPQEDVTHIHRPARPPRWRRTVRRARSLASAGVRRAAGGGRR